MIYEFHFRDGRGGHYQIFAIKMEIGVWLVWMTLRTTAGVQLHPFMGKLRSRERRGLPVFMWPVGGRT